VVAKSNDTMTEDTLGSAETLRNPETPKREIYPEISDKFKGLVIWLGLAFVVIVLILQQFSGYL